MLQKESFKFISFVDLYVKVYEVYEKIFFVLQGYKA